MHDDDDLNAAFTQLEAAIKDEKIKGESRERQWTCEDEHIVTYSTTRIVGGKHHGKFTARLIDDGEEVAVRAFKTRHEAKEAALAAFYWHSPQRARRHRYDGMYLSRP